MKYRLGFVTNSSSTSFIIAIKGGRENLKNLFPNSTDESPLIVLINALLDNSSGYGETTGVDLLDQEDFDLYASDFTGIDSSFKMYRKNADYNDSTANDLLMTLPKLSSDIKVTRCD